MQVATTIIRNASCNFSHQECKLQLQPSGLQVVSTRGVASTRGTPEIARLLCCNGTNCKVHLHATARIVILLICIITDFFFYEKSGHKVQVRMPPYLLYVSRYVHPSWPLCGIPSDMTPTGDLCLTICLTKWPPQVISAICLVVCPSQIISLQYTNWYAITGNLSVICHVVCPDW